LVTDTAEAANAAVGRAALRLQLFDAAVASDGPAGEARSGSSGREPLSPQAPMARRPRTSNETEYRGLCIAISKSGFTALACML
jgi:hypothetical protein